MGFISTGRIRCGHINSFYPELEMRPAFLGPLLVLRYYGPFYFAFGQLFSTSAHQLFPNVKEIDFSHLSYFLSFQLALISLYFICLRWVKKSAAIGATLLFNTQPLLWGHAFINPKDIPFLAFFLASTWSGLWMADSLAREHPRITSIGLNDCWAETPARLRKHFGRGAVAIGAFSLVVAIVPIYRWGEAWAQSAATASSSSWAHNLLVRLAPNLGQIPLETYLAKFALQVPRLKALGIATLWVVFFLFLLVLVHGLANLLVTRVRRFLSVYFPALLAGLVLGLADDIRIIAPAAGLLVVVYCLIRFGRRSMVSLAFYFAVAAFVTYAFWPFLWKAPLENLAASVNEMSNFPKDVGVLYDGQDLRSVDLPSSYLPTLIAIQLTEPVLFLAALGAGFAIWRKRRRELEEGWLLALISGWFVLPLLAIVVLRPTLYDNFRQFLFLLPPLFIFSGIALDQLANKLRPLAYALVLLVLLSPGVFAIIRSHPYEYVYYNGFVGGLAGAEGRFEMDYWATSYREAVEYLNQISPPGAGIYLRGPDHMLRHFGRPDLVAVYERLSQQTDTSLYDYAVLTTRFGSSDNFFPDGVVIHVIGREGAEFSVIKKLAPAP